MDIVKINYCVGLIIDLCGLKTIFISFLMMGNWLCFYSVMSNTLIKKDTFLSKLYHNINVNGDVQHHCVCRCVNESCRH